MVFFFIFSAYFLAFQLIITEINPPYTPWLWGIFITGTIISILLSIALGKIIEARLERRLKKNTPQLVETEIEIGEESITTRKAGMPEHIIRRDEITRILETRFGLFIVGQDIHHATIISKYLSDYEGAKAQLAAWVSIKRMSLLRFSMQFGSFSIHLVIAVILELIGGASLFSNLPHGYTLFPSSIWAILAGSIILVTSYGYIYWLMRRMNGLENKNNRMTVIILGGGIITLIAVRIFVDILISF